MRKTRGMNNTCRCSSIYLARIAPFFARKPCGLPQGGSFVAPKELWQDKMASLASQGSAKMPRGLPRGASLVVLGVFWLGAIVILADTHYVTPAGGYGTNNPPYTNWADAATNIQWAVDAASWGDTVLVTNGSYCLTNSIMITNNITVQSVNGYSNTLVYADWPAWTTRCFYVTRTGVVDGFTISNGHYLSNINVGGGGAYIATSGAISNCYFVNNVASNGGGQFSLGAGAWITTSGVVYNCIFYSNSFAYTGSSYAIGGTVCINGQGSLLNCTVISNYDRRGSGTIGAGIGFSASAGQMMLISNCLIACHAGEGIYGEGQAGLIISCVFSNNGTGIRSGNGALTRSCLVVNNNNNGIYCNSATGTFLNCTSINNSGYGLYIQYQDTGPVVDGCVIASNSDRGCRIEAPSIVRNCLIYRNSSSQRGSGVYLRDNNRLTTGGQTSGLFNCTIVSNYSSANGGGICTTGTLNNIVNCIIASNTSAGSHGDIYDTDPNSVNSNNYYNSCCPATNASIIVLSQGNNTNDPRFVNHSATNYHLLNNSSCINAGTNQSWMTNGVDLDGGTRIRYRTVDMGAYETIYGGTFFSFP